MARRSTINLGDWRLNNRSTGSNLLDTRIAKDPGFGQRGIIYIQITSAFSFSGKIPGRSIKGSKDENGARSDAAEGNSARQKEVQSEERFAVNTLVYARDYRLGRQ
ncbi:hypothetical protein ACTXT7_004398 [Hymenolepis weldensis]